MKLLLQRLAALPAAAVLIAATHTGARVGFVNIDEAVALHPWHALLVRYDREIAALRETLALNPSSQARRAAQSVAAQTRTASRVATAANAASRDRARERAALASVLASRRPGDEMSAYGAQLVRETQATLASFQQAIAAREQRAYEARAQQFREKESTTAFDLAQADGGQRLQLRLKLQDLHLDARRRATISARLAALDATEQRKVDAQRAADAAALRSYRDALQREGEAAIAKMAAQLRAKAAANLAIRRRALAAEATADAALPDVRAKVASFESSYRPGIPGTVAASLRSAGGDISARLGELGAADQGSQRETAAQIDALQAQRAALYRAIVAQIAATADRLARAQGLRAVELGTRAAPASVDLTRAVGTRLARY